MSTIKLTFTILFFSSLISESIAQTMSYSLFKGKIYKIPNSRKYLDFIEDYDQIYPLLNEFTCDSISVSWRDEEEKFPHVDRDGAFGIMYTSVLTVDQTYMYRFTIASDDGSIVWVDDKLILDNDMSKGWHTAEDTIALSPGNHKIKVWYYQAYPTMYGVQFDSGPVDMPLKFDIDTITLDQDLLFESGSSMISKEGKNELLAFAQDLKQLCKAKVRIHGHTDNVGSPEYNQALSMNRGLAIRDFLMDKVINLGIKYHVLGFGDSIPLDDNSHEVGRSRNRRVEVLVEAY